MADTPVVHGEDCICELLVDSTYYPILCATDVTFRIQQEVVLKTGPNSGLFREKTTRLSEAFATVKGLTPVGNEDVISILYLMQEGVRNVTQDIRLTFTDEEGTSKQITGSAIIAISEITGGISDWANASVDFEFSGDVELAEITPPSDMSEEIFSGTWTAVEGQDYISGDDDSGQYNLMADDIVVLEVDREGLQHDFQESGTPGNRCYVYDSSTGRVTFAVPFNDGETVFVLFKVIG